MSDKAIVPNGGDVLPSASPTQDLSEELQMLSHLGDEATTIASQLEGSRHDQAVQRDSSLVAAMLSFTRPRLLGMPAHLWSELTPDDARSLVASYEATDAYFVHATGREADPTFLPLVSLLPDEVIQLSQQATAKPQPALPGPQHMADLIAEAVVSVPKAMRMESKFQADHAVEVPSLTDERISTLAGKLHDCIYGPNSKASPNYSGHGDGYRPSPISRFSLAPGESGGELDISRDILGYTLYYVTATADESSAKLGLWSKVGDAKSIWIVASRNTEGVWHCEGADILGDMFRNSAGGWSRVTEQPTAEQVEGAFGRIEQEVAAVLAEINQA